MLGKGEILESSVFQTGFLGDPNVPQGSIREQVEETTVGTKRNVHGDIHPYSEKALAPHSSTLAWKIPWTEEPGRLQSMGSLRVGHD